MATKYRVRPWRGILTGRIYYEVERSGLFWWVNVLTCFNEQEANEMLQKLGRWDNGQPFESKGE